MASTTAAAHERCESVKVNVTSSVEAAGSGGDEDVACSVAVLDEDVACSVAVLFLNAATSSGDRRLLPSAVARDEA